MRYKIMLGLMMILLAGTVSAISITIDMKDSFEIGDEIFFEYTIISDIQKDIEYIAAVSCPSAPLPLLEIKKASLDPNTPFTEKYTYISNLKDSIEPQICTAAVGSEDGEAYAEESFEIRTNPSFEFDVFACEDERCSEKKHVFIKGETIHLDYNSEIGDVLVNATLTYPNRDTNRFSLPNSIKAEQLGRYILEIIASKQGYKTIKENVELGVIEKEADIKYRSPLSKEESVQLAKKPMQTPKQRRLFFIIPILIVILTVSFIAYLELFRKRDENLFKLKNYMKKNLAKGYTKEQIKKELVKDGWDKKMVDKVLKR